LGYSFAFGCIFYFIKVKKMQGFGSRNPNRFVATMLCKHRATPKLHRKFAVLAIILCHACFIPAHIITIDFLLLDLLPKKHGSHLADDPKTSRTQSHKIKQTVAFYSHNKQLKVNAKMSICAHTARV
jgi:hypothetical protein